jgi:hypothetical protein
MDIPLVDKQYLIEKFEGKGGWTYVMIPEIFEGKKPHFMQFGCAVLWIVLK